MPRPRAPRPAARSQPTCRPWIAISGAPRSRTENHCASMPYTSRNVGGVSAASGVPSATILPAMENDDAIGDARGEREIVDRQHDAAALCRERAQQVGSFELMRRVESRERLVREDPVGFAGQHAREQDACTLAAGKRRDRSLRPLRRACRLHRPSHRCLVLRIAGAMSDTESARARPAWRRRRARRFPGSAAGTRCAVRARRPPSS